ncbi:hypothetical protein [Actinomadura xylanilytica]|uniref:hypothetical protein n=1 Tax=Actinomadura xylanilytica TaxID=887459 RepID=UPI00255AE3A9|nr:hypothetical protein [Actinomadura xylanilytica]MDL4773803.1 hypothetical protein [Actinomadura xylanilytica]
MLVTRENVTYAAEPIPHLVVVAPPHMDALPPLTVRDGVVSNCAGWNLAARLAFSVVDGPGEAGFMVQGANGQRDAKVMLQWLEAVDKAGGALVIALESQPQDLSLEHLVAIPNARGGSVPFLPPESMAD